MIRNVVKNGFTLAEVLITIGVIGVVAALTIPNLIQENQKRATVARLQKGISVLNQAYRLSYDDLGEPENNENLTAKDYVKEYWFPYIKHITYCSSAQICGYDSILPFKRPDNVTQSGFTIVSTNFERATFYTEDGFVYSIVLFTYSGTIPTRKVYLDINGSSKPNRVGRDVFALVRIEEERTVVPMGYNQSDEEINENCSKTGKGEYCAEKIRRAGWRIEKDYPW